jgi:hypothetical protein
LLILDRTKPSHHKIGVQVVAGIIVWLGLAVIVRFIAFLATGGFRGP